jgi:hypothetical protein
MGDDMIEKTIKFTPEEFKRLQDVIPFEFYDEFLHEIIMTWVLSSEIEIKAGVLTREQLDKLTFLIGKYAAEGLHTDEKWTMRNLVLAEQPTAFRLDFDEIVKLAAIIISMR